MAPESRGDRPHEEDQNEIDRHRDEHGVQDVIGTDPDPEARVPAALLSQVPTATFPDDMHRVVARRAEVLQ